MARDVKIKYSVDTAGAIKSTNLLTKAVNKHRLAMLATGIVMKRMVGIALGPIGAFVAGGIATVGFTKHLLNLTGTMESVSKSFKAIVQREGIDYIKLLEDLQAASFGTIDSLELMKKANQAAFLGLDISRLDDLLKVAKGAAQATGQSFEFMFDSIVLGIGRQSKLILDNLGILVSVEEANEKFARNVGKLASQLTDVERRQAFFNEAMDKGLGNLKKMGGLSLTTSDRLVSLKTAWKDLRLELSELVAPLAKIVSLFAMAVRDITAVVKALKDMNRATAEIKLARLRREAERLRAILGLGDFAPPAGKGFQPGFKIPTPDITLQAANFQVVSTAIDKTATAAGRFADVIAGILALEIELAKKKRIGIAPGAALPGARFPGAARVKDLRGDILATQDAMVELAESQAFRNVIDLTTQFEEALRFDLAGGINRTLIEIVNGTASFKGAMLNIWNSLLAELLAQASGALAGQIVGAIPFASIFAGPAGGLLSQKVQSTDQNLIAGQLEHFYAMQ